MNTLENEMWHKLIEALNLIVDRLEKLEAKKKPYRCEHSGIEFMRTEN